MLCASLTPNAQISGRVSALPMKGLSRGIEPSALMCSTLPIRLPGSCDCVQFLDSIPRPASGPESMNSEPSGAWIIRPSIPCVFSSTLTSVSCVSSADNWPRPTISIWG